MPELTDAVYTDMLRLKAEAAAVGDMIDQAWTEGCRLRNTAGALQALGQGWLSCQDQLFKLRAQAPLAFDFFTGLKDYLKGLAQAESWPPVHFQA
jgi:hypothetical protein